MVLQTQVLQFGTSRFLQAHADLFFSQADADMTVTVVQSSGDTSRQHRLAALADPSGFPVRVKGLEQGQEIDREERVTSVKQCFSTAQDWDDVCRVGAGVSYILSNTSDRGYDAQPSDLDAQFTNDMSFPAKLTHLLHYRFKTGAKAPTLLPTELIPDNGDVLKTRVLDLAEAVFNDVAFATWLQAMPAANSIVDRIVSEPIEPAGAVAEPYALWALQKADGLSLPFTHPAIEWVDSLEEAERLKLHILNLGHTYIADLWQVKDWPKDMNVLDFMRGDHCADLMHLYETEVIPAFALKGLESKARAYVATTVDRFANPFLDHRIADIAQNHGQKIDRRIGAFVSWIHATDPECRLPTLSAILKKGT
ncbi:tagaturonate reductase [Pacificibacter maritimus]|uniref:Tagaturonate reductase n=1 Tax=Pacificibacter maritimus TaxID=762213 RepID=A0A3N4TWP2_9RHOB|nr:mannitol dehydrogenase family protein [Pacificibacter maritimus]RPE62956.1 tagaturonate reductase [Pacificibacter maritimus]